MKIRAFAAVALAVLFSAAWPDHAAGEAPQTALDSYRGSTQYGLLMCSMAVKMELIRADANEAPDAKGGARSCISTNKAEAKAKLDAALRTVKKAKARDALKNVHVAFSVALDGLPPGINERRISYEQRQQALEGKLTEAWARFEIEE